MRYDYVRAILMTLLVGGAGFGQLAFGQQVDGVSLLKSPAEKLAFLQAQFAGKVVPQSIRGELKTAIRRHLAEDGPAPLGGELYFSEGKLALRLITEPSADERRLQARVLAGVRKLKSGRASDAPLLIEYGEEMIAQVKECYATPPPDSAYSEGNRRRRDTQIKSAGSALKLLGLAGRLPAKNVATMVGVYETSVLGMAHPTYKVLPSRRLTMRDDRCGLLLVKFEVFDPSDQELDALRKATGLPLVILDVSQGFGRLRLDDDGLKVVGKGRLADLFPES